MLHSKKVNRYRKVKKSRRNKKRNGGASGASRDSRDSRDSGASASSTFHIPDPKRGTVVKRTGFLGARGGPDSAMFRFLEGRLLQPQTTGPRHPHMDEKLHRVTYNRVKTKKVENELFRRAERLHATSFRYRTHRDIAKGELQRCIDANVEAVKLLREATEMGNTRARACLADMLLNGYTAGVGKDISEAMRLVFHVDDPDCQGVLAHCHFNSGIKDGPGLAALSASAGSKYGQYVLGLYEKRKGDIKKASEYFTLAAAQNYEEAQIALSEIQSDQDESLRLLNLAADQGNANAFFLIAGIYSRQSNYSQSNYNPMAFHNAMYWYNLALKVNHPYAFDAVSALQQLMRR